MKAKNDDLARECQGMGQMIEFVHNNTPDKKPFYDRSHEIMVADGWPDESEWQAIINEGKAVAFYVLDWHGLEEWIRPIVPNCELWYTERNGDLIVLLVPVGLPHDAFPSFALSYATLEWIHPDWDFGDPRTVRPLYWRNEE